MSLCLLADLADSCGYEWDTDTTDLTDSSLPGILRDPRNVTELSDLNCHLERAFRRNLTPAPSETSPAMNNGAEQRRPPLAGAGCSVALGGISVGWIAGSSTIGGEGWTAGSEVGAAIASGAAKPESTTSSTQTFPTLGVSG